MKSKVLIDFLQKEDPSGEIEVVVGSEDIYYLEHLPAYYDGSLRILIRDEKLKPYFDVVGMKEIREGNKISIITLGLSDLIFDDDENKMVFKGSDYFLEEVKKYKHENDKLLEQLDIDHFFKFCAEKFGPVGRAFSFFQEFKKQLRRKDFNSIGSSFNDKREKYWSDCVKVGGEYKHLLYIPGFENKIYE